MTHPIEKRVLTNRDPRHGLRLHEDIDDADNLPNGAPPAVITRSPRPILPHQLTTNAKAIPLTSAERQQRHRARLHENPEKQKERLQ